MAGLGLIGVLVRELSSRRYPSRVPEPNLVMDDDENVTAYTAAGREVAVMAPTHLFHAMQASEVIGPGDLVLDLGCGPGTQLAKLAALNPKARFIGLDLSQPMLDAAHDYTDSLKLTNVSFQCGDVTDLAGFEDAGVGAVVSSMTLHHLPDLDALSAAFGEVARVLKPGGGLYLADFARLSCPASMRFFAHDHADEQPELFTLDYWNSLRAAFSLDEFERAAAPLLSRASIYHMAPIRLLIAIKSPPRRSLDEQTVDRIRQLIRELPWPQQKDFQSLRTLFRFGGLSSAA